MSWLAIRLQAEARLAETFADALMEAGALSVSCDDADAGTSEETAQFAEPGLEVAGAWSRNILTAMIPTDVSPHALVETACHTCAIEVPPFSVSTVEDQDWVRSTQAQFEPLRITDGLWIVPSWCSPPQPAAINIRIDPGLAFGTGSHPTTMLMLRWLANTVSGGETLLDYGCGSGILAIAARKLGAKDAIGVDIDPQAVLAADQNALANGVSATFLLPDHAPTRGFDIVVANILANPIIMLAPLLTARSSRRIALSGILDGQGDEVMAAYAIDFELKITDREENWVLITGTRR